MFNQNGNPNILVSFSLNVHVLNQHLIDSKAMQFFPSQLIYIKTNLFLQLVRNISVISTFLMQDLTVEFQGFFLSQEDDKEHI